ncbi:phosphoethanolamine transferase [Pasteurella sp. PK-2025]|uniref:phosphoethanolamine transferase n=1 Tax=unclassified Pasteurella TaxID=2621516 RepID=UPI003C757C4F
MLNIAERINKIVFLGTALFALALVLLISHFLLLGSGFWTTFSPLPVLSLGMVIILLSASKKSFYFLLLPLVLCHLFYMPVGLNFGAPSYQYLASVLSTDLLESQEFLLQIPITSYLLTLSILPLLFLYRWLTQTFQIQFYKNHTFLIGACLIFAYYSPAAMFLKTIYQSGSEIKVEFDRLNQLRQETQWKQVQLPHSHYDDYVLIIGESARKDYHHAYGYPIDNTPFMSHAKGTLIDGFTSAGTNTVASLRLMLTLSDKQKWQPKYEFSLIDLINAAGIQTYWLSNQGFLGEYDTPIAVLASKSQHIDFLKKGGSFNSTNSSDFELLPKLAQILAEKSQGPRFIVLHLYGSHPLACDRLTDFPRLFKEGELPEKYEYLNCYISTIKKTDSLLENVYQLLAQNFQKNDRTFSMIYFSDHGLCHSTGHKNDIFFSQNCVSQRHNEVPLFKISSDDTERKYYRVFKSGLNFLEGIANWIGIQQPQLNPAQDLFSNQADQNDYGLSKEIQQRKTPLEPAIDIRTEKVVNPK